MASFLLQLLLTAGFSILLFNFLWFSGNILFSGFLKTEEHHVAMPVKSILAFVLCGSLIGAIKTSGLSIVTPTLLVLIFIIVKTFNWENIKSGRLNVKHLLKANSFFLLVIISQVIFHIPFNTTGVYANNRDLGFYSHWAQLINERSYESFLDTRIFTITQPFLYHYTELWFCGFVSSVSGINGYFFFVLFYKSFMLFLGSYLMFGFACRFVQSKFARFCSLFFVFIGPLPFLFFIKSSNWLLSFDHNANDYHIIGGYLIILWVIMCFVLYHSATSKFIPLLLLSVAGCINPLFIGIIPLFFGVKFLFAGLFEKRQGIVLTHFFTGGLVSTLIIGFAFIHYGNAGKGLIQVHGIKLIIDIVFIFVRTFIVAIIECAVGVFGLFYLYKQKKISLDFFSSLVIFVIAAFFFLAVFYPSLPGDLYELSFNTNVIVFYFFGFAGVLFAIEYRPEKWKFALLSTYLIYCLIGNFYIVYFTLGIKTAITNFGFAQFYPYNFLESFTSIARSKGNGGATESEAICRYIPLQELSSLSEITHTPSIIRLNITSKDTTRTGDPGYYSSFVKSKVYPIYMAHRYDKQAYYKAIIDSLQIKWIVTNHKEVFADSVLLQFFPSKESTGNYSIYYRK